MSSYVSMLSRVVALLIPSIVFAQSYDNSPMVIVGGDTPKQAAHVAAVAPAPARIASNEAASSTPAAATTSSAPAANTPAKPALPVTPSLPPNFPDWAVSQAAQNTAGNTNPEPSSPANPANPVGAMNGGAPENPASPGTPASPDSPTTKLWPRDTVPIFVKSCIGFHVELIPACTCVITTLMASMPHDEFLKESAENTIESDPRLIKARQQCIATPQRK